MDEQPIDITSEANFIWGIANKLRGTYLPDKYGDVIIPMTIIRRFESVLEPTKAEVLAKFEEMPAYPARAMYKISGSIPVSLIYLNYVMIRIISWLILKHI